MHYHPWRKNIKRTLFHPIVYSVPLYALVMTFVEAYWYARSVVEVSEFISTVHNSSVGLHTSHPIAWEAR